MALREVQQAAVSLFARKGYAATGIRELGQAAGMNSATLYHYAGGKEELLVSIMRGCLDALLLTGRQAVGSTSEPEIQLGRLVATHVGLSAMNPLTARVTDVEVRALTGPTKTELVAQRDEYESLFTNVLERGAQLGTFDVNNLKVARLAILEMCNGVANWYRPGGQLGVDEIQSRFVEYAGRLVGVGQLDRRVNVHASPALQLPTEPVFSRAR